MRTNEWPGTSTQSLYDFFALVFGEDIIEHDCLLLFVKFEGITLRHALEQNKSINPPGQSSTFDIVYDANIPFHRAGSQSFAKTFGIPMTRQVSSIISTSTPQLRSFFFRAQRMSSCLLAKESSGTGLGW